MSVFFTVYPNPTTVPLALQINLFAHWAHDTAFPIAYNCFSYVLTRLLGDFPLDFPVPLGINPKLYFVLTPTPPPTFHLWKCISFRHSNQLMPLLVKTLPLSLGLCFSSDCREGNGPPLQYSCLDKSHGRRSLVGCSPWGRWESDTTERLLFHFSLSCIGEGNGNPLQWPCLENPRDRGAWWAAVSGVAQSRTRLKRLSSSSSSKNYETFISSKSF